MSKSELNDELTSTRVTRSLRNRVISVESETTSRPGTPINSEIESIIPGRVTRRRSITNDTGTPVKSLLGTPRKALNKVDPPAINSPMRRSNRRRSFTSDDELPTTKSKILNISACIMEEEPEQLHQPISLAKPYEKSPSTTPTVQIEKRVTRLSSNSPKTNSPIESQSSLNKKLPILRSPEIKIERNEEEEPTVIEPFPPKQMVLIPNVKHSNNKNNTTTEDDENENVTGSDITDEFITKNNASIRQKSVQFDNSEHEENDKPIFPKTPLLTKSKSYIQIDSSESGEIVSNDLNDNDEYVGISKTPGKPMLGKLSSSTPIVSGKEFHNSMNDSSNNNKNTNNKTMENMSFAKSWNQSIKVENGAKIDELGLKELESIPTAKMVIKNSSIIKNNKKNEDSSEEIIFDLSEEEVEGEEEANDEESERNEFISDEAEEGDDESLSSGELKYQIVNEVPVYGESIGSSDTTEKSSVDEDDCDNDSFIVSDTEQLLIELEDDEENVEQKPEEQSFQKKAHKKIQRLDSSSDEEKPTQNLTSNNSHQRVSISLPKTSEDDLEDSILLFTMQSNKSLNTSKNLQNKVSNGNLNKSKSNKNRLSLEKTKEAMNKSVANDENIDFDEPNSNNSSDVKRDLKATENLEELQTKKLSFDESDAEVDHESNLNESTVTNLKSISTLGKSTNDRLSENDDNGSPGDTIPETEVMNQIISPVKNASFTDKSLNKASSSKKKTPKRASKSFTSKNTTDNENSNEEDDGLKSSKPSMDETLGQIGQIESPVKNNSVTELAETNYESNLKNDKSLNQTSSSKKKTPKRASKSFVSKETEDNANNNAEVDSLKSPKHSIEETVGQKDQIESPVKNISFTEFAQTNNESNVKNNDGFDKSFNKAGSSKKKTPKRASRSFISKEIKDNENDNAEDDGSKSPKQSIDETVDQIDQVESPVQSISVTEFAQTNYESNVKNNDGFDKSLNKASSSKKKTPKRASKSSISNESEVKENDNTENDGLKPTKRSKDESIKLMEVGELTDNDSNSNEKEENLKVDRKNVSLRSFSRSITKNAKQIEEVNNTESNDTNSDDVLSKSCSKSMSIKKNIKTRNSNSFLLNETDDNEINEEIHSTQQETGKADKSLNKSSLKKVKTQKKLNVSFEVNHNDSKQIGNDKEIKKSKHSPIKSSKTEEGQLKENHASNIENDSNADEELNKSTSSEKAVKTEKKTAKNNANKKINNDDLNKIIKDIVNSERTTLQTEKPKKHADKNSKPLENNDESLNENQGQKRKFDTLVTETPAKTNKKAKKNKFSPSKAELKDRENVTLTKSDNYNNLDSAETQENTKINPDPELKTPSSTIDLNNCDETDHSQTKNTSLKPMEKSINDNTLNKQDQLGLVLNRCKEILGNADQAREDAKIQARKNKKPKQPKEVQSLQKENILKPSKLSHTIKKQADMTTVIAKALKASTALLSTQLDAVSETTKKIKLRNANKSLTAKPLNILKAFDLDDGKDTTKAKMRQQNNKNSLLFTEEPLKEEKTKKNPFKTFKSSSGPVEVQPVTPTKKKTYGFEESSITPKPLGFKIRNMLSAGQKEPPTISNSKQKLAKKRHYIDEPVTVLPKPILSSSGVFVEEAIKPIKIKKKSQATEFFVSKKSAQSTDIFKNALNFKNSAFFNDGILRESSKNLLSRKQREKVKGKF